MDEGTDWEIDWVALVVELATQFPLLQVWPDEQATAADQVRQLLDETQVCTPLPEHCFAPEVH
jgi:hypothetical protein